MPALTLLKDPKKYRPCPQDMLHDAEYRRYWLEHFKVHSDLVERLAVAQYGRATAAKAAQYKADLLAELAAIEARPDRWGELNLIVLDMVRQQKLRAHDIPDPFESLKARENAAMLQLYPQVVAELDSHAFETPSHELLLLTEGVLAGNIFDMGALSTAARFSEKSVDFLATRDSLEGKRPWLVDHFDAFAGAILAGKPHRKALFFLDNAGSDCILGMLPLARWMARRGTTVALAANLSPALNDVTFPELVNILRQVGEIDPVMKKLLEAKKIRPVNSGGICPLIDLRHISDELNAEAADVDLLLLDGMGRAVESNYDALFKVDTVKICMLKDPMVVERMGGKLYDPILKFEAAGSEKM